VLFVLPSLRVGGAERVIVTLLRHLNRTRFEPRLAVVEKAGGLIKDVPADVPVHDLRVSRVRYALPGLVRLVWKLRPRAVLSTLVELNLALVASKPLLPAGTRLLVRETIAVGPRLAQSKRWPQIWLWLYRWLYPRADRIICIADFVAEELGNQLGIPRARMRRIYNPVDIERVRQLAAAGPCPYAGPGPHLVALGRLSKQKGAEVLLSALDRLRSTLPTAALTLVGEGPLEVELKALRDRLGLGEGARFAGFLPNPYPYLRHADVLVLASRYEGLPNVLLEAITLGTPVVATDCAGGVGEILAPMVASGAAWLVPPDDPEKLAEAIIVAWTARQHAARSMDEFDRLVRPFGAENVAREYEQLLAE
jgi:glycosyltransferase involved in cell wall biosynthesis